MLYVVCYVSALLQNVVFIFLVRKACGFELTNNKLLFCLATVCSAVPQLVFLLPSKQIPPPVRILLLMLLMLLKAGCYAAVFKKLKLSMLYISILSFVLNTNYTTVMHLFTDDKMILNIVACIAETCVTAAILLYIGHENRNAAVMHSLELIPSRLYVMILIFLFFLAFFEHATVIPKLNSIARMLIVPVVLIISYIIAQILKISAVEKEHKRISDLLAVQLENQVKYYQKINDIYAEFRAFRHDFRNHLLCVRSLLAENEVQRACEYMDEIESMSHTQKKNYDTGNIIVDSLLNDKNEKAAQYHAQILFSGYAPTNGITSADLCTIFSNALDNAIEACAKDESDSEKKIEIHSDFQQGYFCLKITNPVFEKVEIRNSNQIQTSKKDKNMHGFGVANIVKTARKYNGDVELSSDGKLFTLEANLWLNLEI